MQRDDGELKLVKERIARLEQEMSALQGQQRSAVSRNTMSEGTQATWQHSAEIPQLHRETMRVLSACAKEARGRVIFVATADEQTAATGGPDSAQQLANATMIQPLAYLGVAIGHPSRVKMVRLLLLQGECTVAELVQISETSGGNLYQHLDAIQAANLLYQPGRGRYRLTEDGQRVAAVLFWCALQVGVASPAQQ